MRAGPLTHRKWNYTKNCSINKDNVRHSHKIISRPQNNNYIIFKLWRLFTLQNLGYFSWCDSTERLRSWVFKFSLLEILLMKVSDPPAFTISFLHCPHGTRLWPCSYIRAPVRMIKFASPVAISLASILTLSKSWPGIWLPSAINPAGLHQQSHSTVSTYPAQPQALLLHLVRVLPWATVTAESCSHLPSSQQNPSFHRQNVHIHAQQPSSLSQALRGTSARPKLQLSEVHGSAEEHNLTAPRSLHLGYSTGKVISNLFQRQPCLSWMQGNEEQQDTCYHSHLFYLMLNQAQLIETPGEGRLTCHWTPLLTAFQHKCNKTSQLMQKIPKMIHGSPSLSSFAIYRHHLWKK